MRAGRVIGGQGTGGTQPLGFLPLGRTGDDSPERVAQLVTVRGESRTQDLDLARRGREQVLIAGWGIREAHGSLQAHALTDRLLAANSADVPRIVRDMTGFRPWVDPLLRQASLQAESDQDARKLLHARLALLPVDPGQKDYLYARAEATVVLTVADTGIGIPDEQRAQVFERFHRVDAARAREEGGCGLGLAICLEIVRAHGGTISVDSQPQAGSTFTVSLPADRTT